MHILLIAPQAPPKNSPEAMQVGRYMSELAKRHRLTLVTTPVEQGWVREDSSLKFNLEHVRRIMLELPFHNLTKRVLASRYLSAFRLPDADAWLQTQAGKVVKELGSDIPDVIYSRSLPLSAALLGKRLNNKLERPWVMHLSDPWADSPYRHSIGYAGRLDDRLERGCFATADAVTVTTHQLRDFYVEKYPQLSGKIFVSANVLPLHPPDEYGKISDGVSHNVLVAYTGALYGERNPKMLAAAFNQLSASCPGKTKKLHFVFAGNMYAEVAEQIRTGFRGQAEIKGPLSYYDSQKLQQRADVLLSIEPALNHRLANAFLPSKIVDYIAVGKPFLAITPEGSMSEMLAKKGFGWAVEPKDLNALVKILAGIADLKIFQDPKSSLIYKAPSMEPPVELTAQFNVDRLEQILQLAINKSTS